MIPSTSFFLPPLHQQKQQAVTRSLCTTRKKNQYALCSFSEPYTIELLVKEAVLRAEKKDFKGS